MAWIGSNRYRNTKPRIHFRVTLQVVLPLCKYGRIVGDAANIEVIEILLIDIRQWRPSFGTGAGNVFDRCIIINDRNIDEHQAGFFCH